MSQTNPQSAAKQAALTEVNSLHRFLAAGTGKRTAPHVHTSMEYPDYRIGTHTAATLYLDLANSTAVYLNDALDKHRWNKDSRRRWWLLIAIARSHSDHPDFPRIIRPFLDSTEWL